MGWAARHRLYESTMLRRFTFSPDKTGRTRFRLVFEAFISRGTQKQDQRQSKEDHRSEARILSALKAISEPHPDAPVPTEDALDTRLRVLRLGGGTLELEQPDFKRLQEYVESTQWTAGLTDVIVELEDALDSAEKLEKDEREMRPSSAQKLKRA